MYTDAEVKERSEKRREAYLAFLADLDAVSPIIEFDDESDSAGIPSCLPKSTHRHLIDTCLQSYCV